MIINHNIAALNTYRQLSNNNTISQKSLEKLSSGLRINRAGDDAAGLAISEKMRGQIRGLEQASRNAQDGISLIQTAEGALNETHSILQRMRELAVQASNDTNTTIDRDEIQKEIDQLVSEIDRIGNNTEFNTKNLLNGGAGIRASITGDTNGAVSVISGTSDTKAGETIQLTAFTAATADNQATNSLAALTVAGVLDNASTLTVNGTTFSFAAGTTVDQMVTSINNADIGVTAENATNELKITSNVVGSASELTLSGTGDFRGFAAKNEGADASVTFGGADAGTNYVAIGNTFTIVDSGNNINGLQFKIDANKTFTNPTTITVDQNNSLSLQIGANANQMMGITIGDMRASALGVDNIDVSSATNATSGITTINNAIETVSAERSKLGAYQNRLEHTINNLGTSAENLTASESRIRDVDMAKEMMEFTKMNILSQAAQAMLAQANQAPQGVLQLLR